MLDAARPTGVSPREVCLYIPPGLKKFKLDLFERIGRKIEAAGGRVIRHKAELLDNLPYEITPIVGCMPDCAPLIQKWQQIGRCWIYWDRGYMRRVFATWLPKGSDMGIPMGFYRWHVGRFQMGHITDVPDDRWRALKLEGSVKPWRKSKPSDKVVIADTLSDYWVMRGLVGWSQNIANELKRYTKRPIVIRHKESKLPLDQELVDAHCLVTHGSIAAVEAVVMGCPVFVDRSSTAALVGMTDFSKIETPIYPERQKWLNALAYCQYTEEELVDGTLWRLIS